MIAGRPICKLARFGLTTANAGLLAIFYERALGCSRLADERLNGPAFEKLMGVGGGADRITLRLGKEIIELLHFDHPGRPCPAKSSASDLSFQHFAIVVADMAAAWQRLCAIDGWSVITHGAPQRLPKSAGNVTAFKFRDPEGHPLELLAFPPDNTPPKWRKNDDGALCLGIDHSAISVLDSAASIAFYEDFGLQVSARSFNQGVEQEKLDDVAEARVEVIALSPREPAPHLELLRYHGASGPPIIYQSNDIAATRLTLELCEPHRDIDAAPEILTDPDGHHVMIISPTNRWRPG